MYLASLVSRNFAYICNKIWENGPLISMLWWNLYTEKVWNKKCLSEIKERYTVNFKFSNSLLSKILLHSLVRCHGMEWTYIRCIITVSPTKSCHEQADLHLKYSWCILNKVLHATTCITYKSDHTNQAYYGIHQLEYWQNVGSHYKLSAWYLSRKTWRVGAH